MQRVPFPLVIGVLAIAAMLGGCVTVPYDESGYLSGQEYATADYYGYGPGYYTPFYEPFFFGFAGVGHFHHDRDFAHGHGFDHAHDFHHGAMHAFHFDHARTAGGWAGHGGGSHAGSRGGSRGGGGGFADAGHGGGGGSGHR